MSLTNILIEKLGPTVKKSKVLTGIYNHVNSHKKLYKTLAYASLFSVGALAGVAATMAFAPAVSTGMIIAGATYGGIISTSSPSLLSSMYDAFSKNIDKKSVYSISNNAIERAKSLPDSMLNKTFYGEDPDEIKKQMNQSYRGLQYRKLLGNLLTVGGAGLGMSALVSTGTLPLYIIAGIFVGSLLKLHDSSYSPGIYNLFQKYKDPFGKLSTRINRKKQYS